MPPEPLSLELWMLRKATRWWLRPWRRRLLAAAHELQRRAVEMQRMREQLDTIIADAQDRARCERGLVIAELSDIVDRRIETMGDEPRTTPADELVMCEECTHELLRTEAVCTADGIYLCAICADCEDGDAEERV